MTEIDQMVLDNTVEAIKEKSKTLVNLKVVKHESCMRPINEDASPQRDWFFWRECSEKTYTELSALRSAEGVIIKGDWEFKVRKLYSDVE